MSSFMDRLIQKSSLARLGGFAVAGSCSIIGGALYVRQRHLRSCVIIEAADQQLRSADAVRALLGAPVRSTNGIVGGYTDPIGGTAVITMPIVGENGVEAVARVEAEAEWVQLKAEAEARGEVPPEPKRSETCRWLLRHLEVERVDGATAAPVALTDGDGSGDGGGGGGTTASDGVLTLYSLPQRVPTSLWAPSREPSMLPRWLRALLPEPNGVKSSEAFPRVLMVGGVVVLMHALAFRSINQKMVAEKALRRAEALLTLAETPAHVAMRDRAIELAAQTVEASKGGPVIRSAGSLLYGRASAKEVVGFTALRDKRELFFRAEKSDKRRAEWVLTYIAVEPTELWSKRLAKLPDNADAETLLENMLAGVRQTQPLATNPGLSRQVIVK